MGTQGVGRATALLFAKKGFNVVVAARDMTKLQYVAHDCAQAAGRVGSSLAVQCDVTNERSVRDLLTAVLSKYENVDVVSRSRGCRHLPHRAFYLGVKSCPSEPRRLVVRRSSTTPAS